MPTILIVDDDAVDRELAERCLQAIANVQVRAAEDGDQALEIVDREAPDLVLTDLRMPGMTGIELVEILRERFPMMPVILMTSQGSESIAVRALQAGASSYVPKREMKEILAETVRQMLEIAEARTFRRRVLGHLNSSEDRFELVNDPSLIYALVGYVQDNLELLSFGDEPARSQVGIALAEALSNAIVHGNLEIDSALRQSDRDAYHRQIEERCDREPWNRRRVRFIARESRERVEYVVEDEGPGFDSASLPDPTSADNMLETSGRGVWLIRTFMDEVEYNEKGNRLTMVKRAGRAAPDSAE